MSGLWLPKHKGVTLLPFKRFRARQRIVTLPTGERVMIETDDSGTVTHTHHNHTLDATVRPRTIIVRRNA